MRSDEDIENKKYPVKKAKTPLVLRSAVDPPKAKPIQWARLRDEIAALLPQYPDQTPADRAATAAREQRLSIPANPSKPLNRAVRAAREALPTAAQSGVTTALIASAQPRTNAMLDRRIPQPPLASMAARNPAPEIAEPGILDSLREVVAEPSRLHPLSEGFAEGAGAAAPIIAASTIDPAGGMLGGAAFKLAGAGARAAVPAVKTAARAVADIPLPTNALAAAGRLARDESGQALPNWGTVAAKNALDAADTAFENAGQAVGRAAGAAGTVGKAVLDTGAARIAPRMETIGDALHKPKVWAEDAATAIANKIDLPSRTGGRTLDDLREEMKYKPAATSSPKVNWLIDNTRRFFISDFGMTPSRSAIHEAGRVFGEDGARPLEEIAVRFGKERTDAEQVDIYKYATGMDQPPGPFNVQAWQDGNAVRAVSRDADRKLEDIGALPDGMTDLYDGTHLPRGYTMHWNVEGKKGIQNFTDYNDAMLGGYYRRGLDETMSENDLLARQASAGQTGENWRVVSRNSDGTVNAHRDWTEQERKAWGEIEHASSALQRKANRVRREGQRAYILDAYSQPGAGDELGEFAFPAPANTAGAPVGMMARLLPDKVERNGQLYKLLDANLAKESSIPRYGKLANHYVRDDVWFYLKNENELKPFIDNINKYSMNNLWKKMVTIGNFPGYFVNNFFQNPLILERTGGSMMDMPAAWTDLATNSVDVQRMVDAGVIRNGVLARELGSQLQTFNKTLSSNHMTTGFSIPKQIFRAMNALKKVEQDGYRLAGASDDLYRVAMVKGLMRREGKTFEEAAAIAKEAFYDSHAVNAPAAQIASVISPFAKVLWWAADNEAKAWTRNPGKAAYVNALLAALPVAANYALGKSGAQQDAEQLSLRKNMQGFGNNFPVPYRDAKGANYYWDTSNFNHYNQFKSVDNTAMPYLPRGLAPGGPMMTGLQYAMNYDAFTGNEIVEMDNDGAVINDDGNAFLARNLSPGAGRNAVAAYDSLFGAHETGADTTARIARNLTGIKLQPANIQEGMRWNEAGRKQDERKYGKRINKAEKKGDESKVRKLKDQKNEMIRKAQDRNRRMQDGQ